MIPAKVNPTTFPPGIVRAQITVAIVRSLSLNHLLQNAVICVKNTGDESIIMTVPTITGQ